MNNIRYSKFDMNSLKKGYSLWGLMTLMLICTAAYVFAGIPQPDVIMFGNIIINGTPVLEQDNVTVIARVDGVAQPVGRFRMGQSAGAGDHYVLRIRLQASVSGSPVDNNASQVGQSAQIFVQLGSGPEELATTINLAEIGMLLQTDLIIATLPANCVADNQIDLNDYKSFRTCMAGPNIPSTKECACADVDGDSDVDLRDWSWLQRGFTGTTP